MTKNTALGGTVNTAQLGIMGCILFLWNLKFKFQILKNLLKQVEASFQLINQSYEFQLWQLGAVTFDAETFGVSILYSEKWKNEMEQHILDTNAGKQVSETAKNF